MKKYIDADLLRKEIDKWEEAIEDDNSNYSNGMRFTLRHIIFLLDSFQQEQPSLPSNLDEAAEEYAYNNWEDNDYHTGASEGLPFDAIGHTEKCFKAGAEWMARQMKQEHQVLPGIKAPGIPGKDYIPVEWVDACETYGKWKIVKQEQPDVELEKEFQEYWYLHQYDHRLRRQVVDGHGKAVLENIARHFYELGLNARKEESK